MAHFKSPISILQEVLIQQRKVPVYQEHPSDLPQFRHKCIVTFDSITACGYAHTKKQAKQNCAQEALLKIGSESLTSFEINNNNSIKCVVSPHKINYTGKLNEFAASRQVTPAEYCGKLQTNGEFLMECSFQGVTIEGLGQTKKIAKQEASKLMLERLEHEQIGISKKELISVPENIKLIIDKFDELFINNNENISAPPSNFLLPKFQDKIKILCIDELLEKLKELGHICKLEVFQTNPYIMALQSETTFCVMGHGPTEKEAIDNLLVNCNIILFC